MKDARTAKFIIVDDDSDFSDILSIYLRKINFTDILVAHDFTSGKKLIDEENPDLVLLDIDLREELTGIDLGIYVKQTYPNVSIIFFTNNFSEVVYDAAKKAQPNAFLDKQLNDLKVRQAVELALINKGLMPYVMTHTPPPFFYLTKDFIFVKVGNVFKKINLKDIDYIFYADRYANLQVSGKNYSLNMALKDLVQNLSDTFIQIHQSYIVNLQKISQVNLLDNQLEIEGKWLPIGVSYKKVLRNKLMFLT